MPQLSLPAWHPKITTLISARQPMPSTGHPLIRPVLANVSFNFQGKSGHDTLDTSYLTWVSDARRLVAEPTG
jgi:hypothetical protein